MKQQDHVIERAIRRMTDLDAAGYAMLILRCDREADIRKVVAGYRHCAGEAYTPRHRVGQSPDGGKNGANMLEVTGLYTVKRFGTPFRWNEHGLGAENEMDYNAQQALMKRLSDCADAVSGRRHTLLYFPRLFDVIGESGDGRDARTMLQRQYLYLLRDIGEAKKQGRSNALIVAGCTDGLLCPELREYCYVLDIEYPEQAEIAEIIMEKCIDCAGEQNGMEISVVHELAEAMRGFREDDIRSVIELAYATSEMPLERHAATLFAQVHDAKRQRIASVKGLKWLDADKSLEVGGLQSLQQWLDEKRMLFIHPHAASLQSARPPKGVLVCGLPGSGKTALAKLTAKKLGIQGAPLPLLQLDLSSLLGKWVGESEANCEMALQAVESVAPCVLLIDELEKTFSKVGGSDANETTMHIFAAFLDWMQKDKDKPVLVIATANKTEALPAEFKRKGRFDETFFVNVPTEAECREIIRIHLLRKVSVLASITAEMSKKQQGEQISSIVDALVRCAARERRFLNGADIETVINAAFCTLFTKDFRAMGEEELNRAEASEQPLRRYTNDEVSQALCEELQHTRSFFDTYLKDTAAYWVTMQALGFREADHQSLLPTGADEYDPETGRFKAVRFVAPERCREMLGNLKEEDYEHRLLQYSLNGGRNEQYDIAFGFALAAKIYHHVAETNRARASSAARR